MPLTSEQQKQINYQLENHQHSRYEVDIILAEGQVLERFIVWPDILRPDITVAGFLSSWLFFNNGLYKNKTVIDIGCGSGIQGVVCGIYGAKKIILSDIAPEAVKNSQENVKNYKLESKVEVYQGNLFENVNEKADVVIFNHPFWPINPVEQKVSISMLGGVELIHKFFDQVGAYLNDDGLIVMPYFHMAGEENDPGQQAPRHGFKVEVAFHSEVSKTLHNGLMSIYKIRK